MKQGHPSQEALGRSVLVTGVSSGIGRATALRLASAGYLVFGSVRRKADADELAALGRAESRRGESGQGALVPLIFDLGRREALPELVSGVEAELGKRGMPGLYALVNNAGGSLVAPVELMNLEAFEVELRSRLIGALGLVQAFLPSLRRAGGRLLWIATPGTIPTAFVTGIHACDFAVNCIARTLALELGRSGPPVVLIRCGGIRTRAGLDTKGALERGLAGAPPERRAIYEEKLSRWSRSMTAFDERRSGSELVAETIERALSAPRPRKRYRVGYMSGAAAFLEALPQVLVDRILAAAGYNRGILPRIQ
jgi:NAD(P)-dependent dehydrogenase (short-subunit alcohol dehydrogenase family)